MQYTANYMSPLGKIILASDGTALTGLWFDGQAHFRKEAVTAAEPKELPVLQETSRWLDLYFSGRIPEFTPPVEFPDCTPFRRIILDLLRTVPYGTTITYGELARSAAAVLNVSNMSAQAVGNAVSRNPVSIIIPCHRVIGKDGSLTGYAGGLMRKQYLLDLEQRTLQSR